MHLLSATHTTLPLGALSAQTPTHNLNVLRTLFESQGQNLALTVLFVPHSLDSGPLWTLVSLFHTRLDPLWDGSSPK
jgi:hypothetical protein